MGLLLLLPYSFQMMLSDLRQVYIFNLITVEVLIEFYTTLKCNMLSILKSPSFTGLSSYG